MNGMVVVRYDNGELGMGTPDMWKLITKACNRCNGTGKDPEPKVSDTCLSCGGSGKEIDAKRKAKAMKNAKAKTDTEETKAPPVEETEAEREMREYLEKELEAEKAAEAEEAAWKEANAKWEEEQKHWVMIQ